MSSIQSITDDISKHSEEYTERSAFESMDFGKSDGISANYTLMDGITLSSLWKTSSYSIEECENMMKRFEQSIKDIINK